MKNKAVIILLILITIGVTTFLLVSRGSVISPSHIKDDSSKLPLKDEYTDPISVESSQISEETNYYTISGSYPKVDVKEIQEHVEGTVSEFKQTAYDDLTSLESKDRELFESLSSSQYSLNLSHESYSYNNTTSVVIYENTYTLGAHGNTSIKTFIVDNTTKNLVGLEEIFKGENYLDRISEAARRDLQNQLGDFADTDWILEGAGPNASNFENFYLDKGILSIIFPPYSVAPYAAGIRTVHIDMSLISDILTEEFIPAQAKAPSKTGMVTWGHEVRSFQPCGSDYTYWLRGQEEIFSQHFSGADLKDPYEALPMTLKGEIEPVPEHESGFALEYDGIFLVSEVVKTQPTKGCSD